MLAFGIAEVLINASVLCAILFLVAKHEADYSFPKVAMVTGALALGNFLVQVTLQPHLPKGYEWLIFVAIFLFTAFVIMTFCWITFWKSALAVILFSVWQIGIIFTATFVQHKIDGAAGKATTLARKQMSEMELIKEQMELQSGIYAGSPPDRTKTRQTQASGTQKSGAAQQTVTDDNVTSEHSVGNIAPAPQKKTVDGTPTEWREAKKLVHVQGTLQSGNETLASINGRIVEPGDQVSVNHKKKTFTWTVKSISTEGVHLKPEKMSN